MVGRYARHRDRDRPVHRVARRDAERAGRPVRTLATGVNRMAPKKLKGSKRVSYQLIDPESDTGKPIYKLLRDLVREHHDEVGKARFAIAWCTSWKMDVDGRVTLGKCKKASELDRELAKYDFV